MGVMRIAKSDELLTRRKWFDTQGRERGWGGGMKRIENNPKKWVVEFSGDLMRA